MSNQECLSSDEDIRIINKLMIVIILYFHIIFNFSFFVQEFFEYLEKARSVELDNLARKYRAIGPLLTKMEGLVVHTNTGRSTKLQPYYAYWENAVYEALTKVRNENITL